MVHRTATIGLALGLCLGGPPAVAAEAAAPFAWKRSTPEEQGIHSEVLLEGLRRIDPGELDTHGLIIVRHGHVVLECYVHPYGPDTLHNVKSVSKSVMSALAGIALREGVVDSLDQRVHEFFPEHFDDDDDPRKRRIAIRHLLTMTSGLDLDENGPIMQGIFASDDWIEATFARPMATDPGAAFVYSTPLTHTFSGILTETSGRTAFDFAKVHLFTPLGIEHVQWTTGRDGYSFGGSEVFMTPRDMAKFGLLYLNRGRWQGREIVPESWVEVSTRNQLGDSVPGAYGYGWWPNAEGRYGAMGWGGQGIGVDPAHDLVAVGTAGGSGSFGELFSHLDGYEPSDGPLPPNPEGVAELERLVRELGHPAPRPLPPLPARARAISGQRYVLDENPRGLRDVTFDFPGGPVAHVVVSTGAGELAIDIGLDGVDRVSDIGALGRMPEGNRGAHRGEWTADDTFTIDGHEVGNPMHSRMVFVFDGDELEITTTSRPLQRRLVVTGRRADP
ncbi:MAG: serine hydrolase domain-containing protein [Planctomycetota bacterium]|jgi:CubicO group peptidase (beta-lactamase class C family)